MCEVDEETVVEMARMEKDIYNIRRAMPQEENFTHSEVNSPLILQKPKKSQIKKNVLCSMHSELKQQTEPPSSNESSRIEANFGFHRNPSTRYTTATVTPEKTTLKNCFSEIEMNRLINEVSGKKKREPSRENQKDYSQYRPSVERKYSPKSFVKNNHRQQPHQPYQPHRCKSPVFNIYSPVTRTQTQASSNWREAGPCTRLSTDAQWM